MGMSNGSGEAGAMLGALISNKCKGYLRFYERCFVTSDVFSRESLSCFSGNEVKCNENAGFSSGMRYSLILLGKIPTRFSTWV